MQDPRRAEPIRPPAPLWPCALLLVGAVVAFGNGLNGPFVFDDDSIVVENPYVRSLWPLARALTAPPQSAVAGRPVISLSLAINYALGQYDVWGYHVWNLGVHVIAALLLFGVIRRTLCHPVMDIGIRERADVLASLSALIWLIHPLQTEVIGYVTQRTESTMGLFYLLTVYSAIRAIGSPGEAMRWTIVGIVACALGMASKESMVSAPMMVLLYDTVFGAGSILRALRSRPILYAGLATTWLVLGALIASGPRWRSAGFASGVSPWTYLLNQPSMISTYLKLAVWPAPLVLDYGVPRSLTLQDALPTGIFVAALLGLSGLAWLKSPPLGFLSAWFWITLSPTSSIVPIATEVGAERRMYLPLAALVVAGVIGVEQASRRAAPDARSRQWAATTLVCVLCGVLLALSVRRNAEYRSETGIWQTVLDRRPHGRARYNMGLLLAERGQTSEAIALYRAALSDEPNAHYALAFELEKLAQRAEAIGHYEVFIRLKPGEVRAPEAHVRLGIVLAGEGRWLEATAALERALEMRPGNADARLWYARVLVQQDRLAEGADQFAQYLAVMPGDADAHYDLGLLFAAQESFAEALPHFERAVALAPRDASKRLGLGNALASAGRLEDATREYREGIRLEPNSPTLHGNLGSALVGLKRWPEALVELERAFELGFDDPDARAVYERLKRQSGR